MTESEIQSRIRCELSKYGVVMRLNPGTFKTQDERYINTGIPPGTSDLEFIGEGYVAFIEVKVPKKNASPKQQNFINRMRALGHRAGVAHSVEEALEIIGKL